MIQPFIYSLLTTFFIYGYYKPTMSSSLLAEFSGVANSPSETLGLAEFWLNFMVLTVSFFSSYVHLAALIFIQHCLGLESPNLWFILILGLALILSKIMFQWWLKRQNQQTFLFSGSDISLAYSTSNFRNSSSFIAFSNLSSS